MKEEKILAIKLDGGMPRLIELENNAECFSEAIGCELIDILEIDIAGTKFDAVIDDEGVYNSPDKVTAIWGKSDGSATYQTLHGTILLTHCNEEGEQISVNMIPDMTAVYSRLISITSKLTGKATTGVLYNADVVPPTKEELLKQIFGDDCGDVAVIGA